MWAALSSNHGAFLKEDGSCYTIGDNLFGQCDVPQLPGDLRYRQVALGAGHTVLLRSDGSAVAHGSNRYFQCDIPPLVVDATYVNVAAVPVGTVLIRSDGCAAVCGNGIRGLILQPPETNVTFLPCALRRPMLMLQAKLEGRHVAFLTLGGEERCRTDAWPRMPLSELRRRLKCEWHFGRLGPGLGGVDAVLTDGRLLSCASTDESIASAWNLRPRRVRGKRARAPFTWVFSGASHAGGHMSAAREAEALREPGDLWFYHICPRLCWIKWFGTHWMKGYTA